MSVDIYEIGQAQPLLILPALYFLDRYLLEKNDDLNCNINKTFIKSPKMFQKLSAAVALIASVQAVDLKSQAKFGFSMPSLPALPAIPDVSALTAAVPDVSAVTSAAAIPDVSTLTTALPVDATALTTAATAAVPVDTTALTTAVPTTALTTSLI